MRYFGRGCRTLVMMVNILRGGGHVRFFHGLGIRSWGNTVGWEG